MTPTVAFAVGAPARFPQQTTMQCKETLHGSSVVCRCSLASAGAGRGPRGSLATDLDSPFRDFGLPVLEAMARGLPVVAANTSALPEVGGDAALYADPNDQQAMAENVQRIVEDKPLRRSLIERGLARAGEFTWRRTAELTCAVYDEALSL